MKNKILQQLNVVSQCRKYELSFWQCPQVLFIIMGLIIIAASIASYYFGQHYIYDPRIVALIVLFIAFVLMIIAFAIVRSVEGLAEASRLKSEFINIVSHQMRAPLTNLEWAVDFLRRKNGAKIDEGKSSYYEIIYENGRRMEGLINSLLTVARIKSGKLVLKKEPFSLEKLVHEVVNRFLSFAEASNVKLVINSDNNLPLAIGDIGQVKMVVEILVDNAIRYTKGGGEVKINLEKKDRHILLLVVDQGIGIPKNDQKYIFQKFFRSEKAVKSQAQGSGLGLYVAKLIIEKLGGKIGFKSQENKGSTFWFTLPIT